MSDIEQGIFFHNVMKQECYLNWHKGRFSVKDLTQLVCVYLFYQELAISFNVHYECRWQLFVISTDLKTDTDGRSHRALFCIRLPFDPWAPSVPHPHVLFEGI